MVVRPGEMMRVIKTFLLRVFCFFILLGKEDECPLENGKSIKERRSALSLFLSFSTSQVKDEDQYHSDEEEEQTSPANRHRGGVRGGNR